MPLKRSEAPTLKPAHEAELKPQSGEKRIVSKVRRQLEGGHGSDEGEEITSRSVNQPEIIQRHVIVRDSGEEPTKPSLSNASGPHEYEKMLASVTGEKRKEHTKGANNLRIRALRGMLLDDRDISYEDLIEIHAELAVLYLEAGDENRSRRHIQAIESIAEEVAAE